MAVKVRQSGLWVDVSGVSVDTGAISGITVQDEGTTVGTQLGITTVNFIGAGVTVTSPVTGTVNVSISGVSTSTLFVRQNDYGCSNPISVTASSGIATIGIGTTSNAYGRRFVQVTEPTGVCDGDIWYDISGAGAIESLWSVGSGVDGVGNQDIYRFSKVGIGTTNPVTRLHVVSSSVGEDATVTIQSGVSTARSRVAFLTNGSNWEIGAEGSAATNPNDFYIYDQTRGVYKLLIGDGVNGELRFNSGYGSAATAYGVRAWVNFNGLGSIGVNQTIRGSGNVTSVFKNASAIYTINMTSMVDANYSAVVFSGRPSSDANSYNGEQFGFRTSTSFRIFTGFDQDANAHDVEVCNVIVLR